MGRGQGAPGLLPLTAVALGAFAETAYVFPEDKGKKETSTIYIRGSKSFSDGQQPLILVDGREVKSMDSLAADRIEAITVLKDSVSMAVYGEKAADGVILVTLKKTGEPGDGAQVPGLKGKVVTVTPGGQRRDERVDNRAGDRSRYEAERRNGCGEYGRNREIVSVQGRERLVGRVESCIYRRRRTSV